jgi:CheY-like chemotaxis protein
MPHTLLLADDSVAIRQVIELTFADEDVRVISVGDGEQAIAMLTQSAPDIVLVDAALPGRSGYEVAEFMRRTPGLTAIPVLLLAGAFERVDQARADAARCGGVLVKPFEPQQIIGTVRDLLGRPAGAAPRPANAPSGEGGRVIQSAPATATVDEYFDRLDRALRGKAGGSEATFAPETPGTSPSPKTPPAVPSAASEPARTGLPLAEAFLALLDAERTGSPGTLVNFEPSDALVAAIAARVKERLSEPVVPLESSADDENSG